MLERLIEKIMAITCNVYILISVSDAESGKREKENYIYNLLKTSRKKGIKIFKCFIIFMDTFTKLLTMGSFLVKFSKTKEKK